MNGKRRRSQTTEKFAVWFWELMLGLGGQGKAFHSPVSQSYHFEKFVSPHSVPELQVVVNEVEDRHVTDNDVVTVSRVKLSA